MRDSLPGAPKRYQHRLKRISNLPLLQNAVRYQRSFRALCAICIILWLSYHYTLAFCMSHFDQEAWEIRGVLRWNKQDSQYAQAAAAKALLPRTQDFQHLTAQTLQQHIPIWVISLARATRRRTTMAQTMAAANITSYELIDGVDFWNACSLTQKDLRRYVHGWRRYMWHHNRTRFSGKVAVDVSHFRLWERIVASNKPAIILEDDIRLTGSNWTHDLLTALNELPEDWDVFYLRIGCCHRLGRNISTHLMPVFGTAGGMAYMLKPAFARKALGAASSRRLNSWVDVILMMMGRHFESNQYMARPPLTLLSSLNSTLTHYTEPPNEGYWEKKWMKYGNLGII